MFDQTPTRAAPDESAQAARQKLSDPKWAWAAYQPDDERPWDLRLAGHLFRRAGFGADWTQLQAALADGPGRSVEKLVNPGIDVAAFNSKQDAFEAMVSLGYTEKLVRDAIERVAETIDGEASVEEWVKSALKVI